MWWGHQVFVAILIQFAQLVSSQLDSAGKFCVVDPSEPEDDPNNSYYCPRYDDDRNPSTYTECCLRGNDDDFRMCCEKPEQQEERITNVARDMGIIFGIVFAILLLLMFIFTYCRTDTYPCLLDVQRKAKYHKDSCLDALCTCDCFKAKRKAERRMEATKMNQIEPLCDSQEELIVPMVILEEKPHYYF